ncbi:MAG: hypothetical protein Q8Q33_07405, partial [Chlamydiota bacterium]|nr:hypothetical protein [Chlamydiota bacterium]
LLKKMDTYLILEEWASYSALTGRWVEVIMGSGKKTLAGIVIGTNPYGAMLLRMPSGDVETIMCGDVHVIGA